MNKGGISCLIILLTILSVSSVYGEKIQNIESKDNISTVEIEKDFQELKSKINTLDENISEIDYKQYVKRLENLE
jgi:peptidoglycan hydrolase CwlO-like protein